MGKSSPPPPDYAPLAQASKEAAEIQAGLGREQLDFAKQQYDRQAPIMERIANQQMQAQSEQMTQARDYYQYQQDTYRPLEQGLVADAQNFDTEAYRNKLATQASADAGLAFGQTQAMNQRSMASMGVNPNSGRFAGMQQQSGLAQAANRANVMTGTRMQADQMGHARKMDAAGLGRGLAGASLGAYGGANSAGSMAGGNTSAAGQNYMNGLGMGASTIGNGQSMQMNGLSSIMNTKAEMYMNSSNANAEMFGAVAGAGTAIYQGSDRRIKDNIVEVGVDQRTSLTLYEFNYKVGHGDPNIRYHGVMAQDVELLYPDAVGEFNGYKTVHYAMLGIEMKEVA